MSPTNPPPVAPAQSGRMGRLSITEAQLLAWVIEVAHLHGWWIVHFRPGRVARDGEETYETAYDGDGKGFPDVVLARDGEVIFRELKSNTGKLAKEQQEWLDELGEFGGVWRPGEEAKILQELSRPWKVQRTMEQRGIRLVDLVGMEERARVVLRTQEGDGQEAVAWRNAAEFILGRRAS